MCHVPLHAVSGVTIYLSDFQRNIVDKLKKDFFSDPSQASLTCAITGPVVIKDMNKLTQDTSGVEVRELQETAVLRTHPSTACLMPQCHSCG